MPVRILVPLFHRTHLLFLGSAFLNDVTLRCSPNPYIMCITRSTGYFGIMHTVIWFCPINRQFVFWCGIVHWFRTIFCLCWHEITISNTSMLTGTSPATLNFDFMSWLWERYGQEFPCYRALCLFSRDC